MSGNVSAVRTSREDAVTIQNELDSKVFYFKTLFETSRELGGLIQPKKILDTFLLMTMGPFGATSGMLGLVNARTQEVVKSHRGLEKDEVQNFALSFLQHRDKYLEGRESDAALLPRIRIIAEKPQECALLPSKIKILLVWTVDSEYSGFLGLGSRVSSETYEEDEISILLNLTNVLVNSLSRALYTTKIQQLNSDLAKKNDTLKLALDQARSAGYELDRRIFHLKSLSDLNDELSPLARTEALIENFLLITMGTLGISQGFGLFYDRETKVPRASARGMEPVTQLDPEAAERLLYKAFELAEDRSLAPMSVSRISTSSQMFSEAGVGMEFRTGYLYVIDRRYLGVLAYGPTISGIPLSNDEEELLHTQALNYIVFLKNAISFETVEALNDELVQRNQELRRTIADLTEARHTIALLERARAHLKTLVQREMERIGRMSVLDLVIIFIFSLALGTLFNMANPQGIALLPEVLFRPAAKQIVVEDAKEHLESGRAIFVDARPKELYAQKHIKGAINVPSALFDVVYMLKLSKLDPEKEIIVYGRTISKLHDEEVAYRLRQRDHENVVVLSGGLKNWESNGYRVE